MLREVRGAADDNCILVVDSDSSLVFCLIFFIFQYLELVFMSMASDPYCRQRRGPSRLWTPPNSDNLYCGDGCVCVSACVCACMRACVRDVFAIYNNNICPRLIMITVASFNRPYTCPATSGLKLFACVSWCAFCVS